MCLLVFLFHYFCFFKQKTAYEMRISDWSSDVCSSDLRGQRADRLQTLLLHHRRQQRGRRHEAIADQARNPAHARQSPGRSREPMRLRENMKAAKEHRCMKATCGEMRVSARRSRCNGAPFTYTPVGRGKNKRYYRRIFMPDLPLLDRKSTRLNSSH